MQNKNTYHIKNSNWWVKGFTPQVSLVLEIIKENKNNLTYNLEYCT